ncbi:MAG: hypothetical protein AAGL49_10030, partial [Pseudomonadota bacterium]
TLRVRLRGYAVVYSAKICSYGSAPATLHRSPGATAEVFVNLMSDEDLAHMDRSELLGFEYDRPPLEAEDVAAELGAQEVTGYVSRFGALARDGAPVRLDAVAVEATPFSAIGQAAALAYIQTALGAPGALDDFIFENIVDEQLRLRRNERLRDAFSLTGL